MSIQHPYSIVSVFQNMIVPLLLLWRHVNSSITRLGEQNKFLKLPTRKHTLSLFIVNDIEAAETILYIVTS